MSTQTTQADATGSALRTPGEITPSQEERRRMISAAAYLRAERRGFIGGDAKADWLAAEAEVEQRLAAHRQENRARARRVPEDVQRGAAGT